jgi:3D (Asp-Asp-Asp) domain-containing protein
MANGDMADHKKLSVAAHPRLKFGTKVIIDGKIYTVRDRGRLKDYEIDVLVATKDEAVKYGRKHKLIKVCN